MKIEERLSINQRSQLKKLEINPIQRFEIMTSLFQGLTYKNALNCVAVLIHILASIDYGGPGGMEWLNSVREFGKFETIVTPTDATFY